MTQEDSVLKRILIILLALGGLRYAIAAFKRYADPDPSDYGHPRRSNGWAR
jgi:hypothetical protein